MERLSVGLLRELFRHLQAFRSLFEAEGVDTLTGPDGQQWSLWDLEDLYREAEGLPCRQKEAIDLCLIANVRERDAAVMMGVSPTNPVAMYATSGLEKLVDLVNSGQFRPRVTSLSQRLRQPGGWARCRGCGSVWRWHGHPDAHRALGRMKQHVCEGEISATA